VEPECEANIDDYGNVEITITNIKTNNITYEKIGIK
jgi:hypothetical protein